MRTVTESPTITQQYVTHDAAVCVLTNILCRRFHQLSKIIPQYVNFHLTLKEKNQLIDVWWFNIIKASGSVNQ